MSTVARLFDDTVVATLTTTFLDSAAALETRLHDSEHRVQTLMRELRHAQQGQARAQQGIVLLRSSHRRASHAATGRLFKQVLADLVASEALPQIGRE